MTEKNSAWREEYHFANCVIRSDTRELLRDGVAQKIERRSFDLILYLLKLEGRVASKDELLEQVWGNHFVSESVIAQSIMKVRKALGITGKEPGPIKTIHRVGYRFASEVRRAIHSSSPTAPPLRSPGPTRILWLPTDCALPRADLSWVRYGLISVATHVLHGHGVPTVPASEAIRLHESLEEDGGHWVDGQRSGIREIGIPMVHSRMTALGEQFRLEWWMQIDGVGHGNQIEGPAPAELALRAAREVALIARMQSGLQPTPGQEARFWEESSQLVSLAVALDQADKALPLMAICIDMPQCPLPIWAEYVLVIAQRGDEDTPASAQRMAQLASVAQDCAHEGWAHLCCAVYDLHLHRTAKAVEQAMSGVALVRHAAPHGCHARALLLASHVLATAGKASEALVLWREAATLVNQVPSPDMVCRLHLLRCELDHMVMGPGGVADTHADGVAAARWLGLTTMTARVQVLQGLQSCARGDWDTCRRQLEAGLKASEKSGSALARLFAHLQLGSLHSRCDDQAGLGACLSAVEQPALRAAPMGSAVGRWLQARRCYLTGNAVQALSLAEEAMEELADFGVWCAEDHWLFVAQLALVAGNRRAARALLQRLQARHEHRPLQTRQATALAVEGMIEYAEGNASKALMLFEQACRLARGTLMANILLFGHTWLALIDGRNPSPSQLAPAGQWVEATREGRHLRAMLLNKPYWAIAQRQPPVLLGTATRPTPHSVVHAGEGGPASYAHYLPLPV
ncbi:winged helix-turn-helix domain-containing protein [Hydrogenophaga sp. PBL-H3]|uniref:winged helix-turn-helix domain-containing protein n=1 Tax=Hydrogenophaga sp. PBL-H3 TaxID=434010 RepID=UPI001358395A|nr:winged helix-turn-helix domain-containing protein [Hydrogenophaga sp. PBL-H3]